MRKPCGFVTSARSGALVVAERQLLLREGRKEGITPEGGKSV